MKIFLRKSVAVIWLVLPPFFLSAFIHLADPDIDGWQGLATHSVMWSVAFLGVLIAPVVSICLCILIEYGRPAFLAASAMLSICCGLILCVLGSGAATVAGYALSFVGSAGGVFTIILLAVIPAVVSGWPRVLHPQNEVIETLVSPPIAPS